MLISSQFEVAVEVEVELGNLLILVVTSHVYQFGFKIFFNIRRDKLPHLAPSWILSKADNLESSSLQDGPTKW